MTKYLCFMIGAFLLTGCVSSPPTVQTNVQSAGNVSVADKPVVFATVTPIANTETAANFDKVVIGDSLVSKKNVDKLRSKNAVGKETSPITGDIGRIVTAAPDDSEISSQMNERGQPIETRVFKNNPNLAKIERLYVTLENPKMTIYLKNGKTVNVPNGKIKNPLTASAAEILQAAGQN